MGGLAALAHDEIGKPVEIVGPELVEHRLQATIAGIVAGGQRIHVADHLIRLAHIAADDAQQRLVDLPAFDKFHDRKEEPFLIDLIAIRPETAAANIDHMRGRGEEADMQAVSKDRRDDSEIMQMAGAEPRVVGNEDIAFEDVLGADGTGEMSHALGHRIDMARCAGDRLGDHPTPAVEKTRRQIARFAHRG